MTLGYFNSFYKTEDQNIKNLLHNVCNFVVNFKLENG